MKFPEKLQILFFALQTFPRRESYLLSILAQVNPILPTMPYVRIVIGL